MGDRWSGTLVTLDEFSVDGRLLSSAGYSERELPIFLLGLLPSADRTEHDGSVIIGTIDRTWREGNDVMGEGHLTDQATIEALMAEDRMACGADMDRFRTVEDAMAPRHLVASVSRLAGVTVYLNGGKGAFPRCGIELD